MPRVSINKYQYIEKDANNFINGKTRECGKTDKDIANIIDLSPSSYCIRRKDGRFSISYIELAKIIEFLSLTDEEIICLMRGNFPKRNRKS